MKRIWRRIRGIVGTGLTWAVGWAGITLGIGLMVVGIPFRFFGPIALSGLFQGFFAGAGFAVILSIAERRRTLEDLSLKRVGLWGALGGILLRLPTLPLVLPLGIPIPSILVPIAIDGLMGAVFASGSVALAKRADTELIGEKPRPNLIGEG
jgi:hypothetical protein